MSIAFAYVITVCCHAKKPCPFFPVGIIIHKGRKDPSHACGNQDDILSAFRSLRDEILAWLLETFDPKAD
jgi:arsenate reductase